MRKLKLFIDFMGFGWMLIVSSTFCMASFSYVFGFDVRGMDSPFVFITCLILTLWGFYSFINLKKYIKKPLD